MTTPWPPIAFAEPGSTKDVYHVQILVSLEVKWEEHMRPLHTVTPPDALSRNASSCVLRASNARNHCKEVHRRRLSIITSLSPWQRTYREDWPLPRVAVERAVESGHRVDSASRYKSMTSAHVRDVRTDDCGDRQCCAHAGVSDVSSQQILDAYPGVTHFP